MRDPQIADMLAVHSHLDDGALGTGVLDAPMIFVSALSTISDAKAYRFEEEQRRREQEAKAKAHRR